jgi:hypothetical protein
MISGHSRMTVCLPGAPTVTVLKEANVIIEWRQMIMKFPVSALFVVAV